MESRKVRVRESHKLWVESDSLADPSVRVDAIPNSQRQEAVPDSQVALEVKT
jgi:hypothetical protein